MPNQSLNEREKLILQAVVHLYITTAEPAGSRALVKRFDLNISPATVRNVMADLEDGGYLQQPHTSSGRVPTDRGYRYYVDYLMHVQAMTKTDRERLEVDLAHQLNDADEILRQTSHMLALISHQTGIVEAPSVSVAEVIHIELMPMQGRKIVVLVADNYGRVRTMVMELPTGLCEDDMHTLNRFLNDVLCSTPVDQLANTLRAKLKEFVDSRRQLAEQALSVLDSIPKDSSNQLFLDGATQLFEQPEFRDVEKAREVFGLLEESDRVVELLRAGIETTDAKRSRVLIGSEDNKHGMEGISVVSAPYHVGGKTAGMVGVLGPRRMPYSRLTGVVEYTASMLGRLLTRIAG